MKMLKSLALAACCILLASSLLSQEKPVFETVKLSDHIYKLTADGGGYAVKVIASVGEDGLLIVDAGQEEIAEDLKSSLLELGAGLPKIIISTHSHVEHIEGNKLFGKEALIIGHRNIRNKLRSGHYLFDEFPDEALPEITFTDSMSIFFNGEEIKLISFAGAHDNSDIIIWFTESKIVCVGALSNGSHFPSVDSKGDVLMYPVLVKQAMELLPDDVTLIPGHGEDGTMEDMQIFYDMLVKTTAIVREGLEKGKDIAALQEEDILKDYESFEISYVDRNQWIQYLVDGIQKPESKKEFYELIYYTLRDQGVDAAIAKYYDIKNNHADEYEFGDINLFIIPYKLSGRKKYPEAIKFLELYNKEYPEGQYLSYSYPRLGDAYYELGKLEEAKKNFEKTLEVNPESARAKEMLEKLNK